MNTKTKRKPNGCTKWMQSEKVREKRSIGLRNSTAVKTHLAKLMQDPRCSEGLLHQHAKVWRLRSPDNRTFQIKNLRFFVKENRHLFPPNTTTHNVVKGLGSLRPTSKNAKGSWFGWTWNSYTEQMLNCGEDILKRNIVD